MPRHALRAFFRHAALMFPLALGGCQGPTVCQPVTRQTTLGIVDGGLPDAIPAELCKTVCATVSLSGQSCAPGAIDDAGIPQAVSCTGTYPCATGRRPAGLVAGRSRSRHEVGRFFAETAQLEEASVHAFRRLAAELRAHQAPEELIAAAERSAVEEIRHARLAGALARRFGARPLRARVRPMPPRSLLALAEENAAEGCVRETFGAAVAGWQSRAAGDAGVRAALSAITADEERHAELAWAVDAWARRRLSRADRRRLTTVRQNAALTLAGEIAEPPPSLVMLAGLPSRQASLALLAQAAPLFAS